MGVTSLTVAPLDDFKIILGIDFLTSAKAIPMPHLGVVDIMKEGSPCMMSVERGEPTKEKALSAIQLKKGVKHRESSYLAVLKTKKASVQGDLPPEIEDVLTEFGNVMPKELPKRLPLRREVDHAIESEPSIKPPTMTPYRMAPQE